MPRLPYLKLTIMIGPSAFQMTNKPYLSEKTLSDELRKRLILTAGFGPMLVRLGLLI